MTDPNYRLAPLTVNAAITKLRNQAVENQDTSLIETCEKALAGNQSARSACIRAWYAPNG